MRTCAICNSLTSDSTTYCPTCGGDLNEFSLTAVALKNFRANPHVRAVRITIADDACSYCAEQLGTYPKEQVPQLPHSGCSHPQGCRCFYEPILDQLFP